jgi:monoamine oxidase
MEVFEIVVIGGGVAGLSAAQKLVAQGCTSVCVVEAASQLGGRVRQVSGVAPWPLEAGPEFVHGAKSALVAVLTEQVGLKLHERAWPNKLYLGDEGRLVGAAGEGQPLMAAVDRLMFDEVRVARA